MSGRNMADGGVGSSNSGGEEAKVNIRGGGVKGLKFYIRANLNTTVLNFKSIVAKECGIPVQHQKLIHRGRVMKDDQTLRSYGIKDNQTVYLVGGSEPAAPSDTTTTTELDPNPQLGSFPEIDLLRQLVQYPNMVRYIFNIPVVQDLFDNPETVCNMLINRRTLGDIVNSNPEVAHKINDPATLRVILNASRDPEICREMMRKANRGKSNTESPPGSFCDTVKQLSEDLERAQFGPKNTISSPAPSINPLPNPWASADTERTHGNSGPLGNPISNTMANSPAVLDFPDLEGLPESILAITGSNEYPEDPMVEETIHRDDEVTSAGTLRRLMDLFGDLATRAGMLPAPQDPPEVQYATQLAQLQELGFSDTQENIRALIATAGDVQAAVERLLQN